MTAERIAELLADKRKIKEEPLESFERLIIAFPYSQSMQLLYALKLESLGKFEMFKNATWQAYFPDKNHLYTKIHGDKDESFQNEVNRIDDEIGSIFSELNFENASENTDNIEEKTTELEPIADNEIFEIEPKLLRIEESIPIILEEELVENRVIKSNNYSEDIQLIGVKKSKKKKRIKLFHKKTKSKEENKSKDSTSKVEKEKLKLKPQKTVTKPKTIVTKTKKKKKEKKKQIALKKLIPALPETSGNSSEDPFVQWLASLKKKEQSIMESKEKKKKTKKDQNNKDLKNDKKKLKAKKSKKTKKSKDSKIRSKTKGRGKKAKKKQKKLQSKIDSSLNRRKEVASPTLAILLAKQGHKKEAIKIYKQLMLNNPEKNSYFAAQIKKLK